VSTRDVNKALYAKLSVDAGLISLGVTGVFDLQAPESQALPVVIFQKQDGEHQYVYGRRAWQDHNYVVKGVAAESKDLAEQLDDRCYTLLNLQPLVLDDGYTMVVKRNGDISYAERLGGTTFYHVGGLYEIMVGDD
jgi:hypothetical protein